jgi:hypothetical protein
MLRSSKWACKAGYDDLDELARVRSEVDSDNPGPIVFVMVNVYKEIWEF